MCTAVHAHADHDTKRCVELTHKMHSHSGCLISNQQHSGVKPTTRPQQIYPQQMKQTSTWFLVLSCRFFFFFFSANQTIFLQPCRNTENPPSPISLPHLMHTDKPRPFKKVSTNMDSHKNSELSDTITFVLILIKQSDDKTISVHWLWDDHSSISKGRGLLTPGSTITLTTGMAADLKPKA